MGTKLLNTERGTQCVIAADNQAAIQMTRREKAISVQYLINALHRQIQGVTERRPGTRIVMRWVPGHEGVEGNERADEKAKRAARGESSEDRLIPIECSGNMPKSKAGKLQRFKKSIWEEAKATFARSPRARIAHKIDRTMPSTAYAELSQALPRRHALVQLRTGHAGLNRHLHKIGKTDSPLCPTCKGAEETVYHYLFRCPAYATQRKELRRTLRRASTSAATLLGRPKAMKHLFKYIHDTKRFAKTRGDLAMPQRQDEKER
jgi:hypothetical protein